MVPFVLQPLGSVKPVCQWGGQGKVGGIFGGACGVGQEEGNEEAAPRVKAFFFWFFLVGPEVGDMAWACS